MTATWIDIGSAVANHLWQSTLFVVVIWLLTLFLRKNRARVRYWLWFAASLKFLIPFSLLVGIGSSIDLGWNPEPTVTAPERSFVQIINEPFEQQRQASVVPTASNAKPASFNWIAPSVFSLWVCGMLVVLISWWRRSRRISNSIRNAEPLTDGPAADALLSLLSSGRVRKPIKLAISNNTIEPGVFGIFRPVLLLPSGISNRLGSEQLEAVLSHELSHIRNRDNLIAAIHMLVEALFWFYPVVWLLGVKLVDERERACDEAVLQSGNEPQTYADGLLKVCEFYLESPLKCVSGVIGSDLKKRIEGIMTHSIGHNLSITKKLLIMGTGVAALMIPLFIGLMNAPQSHARSQDGPKPKFEVASVKPAKREDCFQIHSSAGRHLVFADGTRFQPGRYSGCNALTRIIMDAYPIEQISQLSVKPDWMDEALFHIDAKADGPADIDQMRLMLQSLLEERFNLKIRRETKEAEVYSLVVAKGGPKLQESKDENGNPIVAPPTQEEIDKKMKANKEKILSGMTPDDPIPGRLAVMVRMSPGGTTLTFAGSAVPMEQLANFLTQQVGRTVIDKTGLTGLYDINMDFAPDTTAPGVFVTRGFPGIPGPNLNAGAAGPDAPKMPEFSGPTLFAALQEQLGLKLESDKGPVEYFIIDNIEKPSEN